MRPWPELLAEMFPLDPLLDQGRPWWRMQTPTPRDAVCDMPPLWNRTADQRIHDPTHGTRAELDAREPLPHPGFRVGQIWAWRRPSGDGFNTKLLATDQEVTLLKLEHDAAELGQAPGGMGVKWPLRERFLICDQACPWLAPWTSAEK
jgi:hypothetical protein